MTSCHVYAIHIMERHVSTTEVVGSSLAKRSLVAAPFSCAQFFPRCSQLREWSAIVVGSGARFAMATTSGSVPKAYTGKAHELVPEFGNRAHEYKEYRKRVMLYERKMFLSGRQKETAFNLMSTLTGRAWSAVEDLNISDLESDDGTKKLLERLDTVFKYDALTELPYDFETFFFHTYRRRNQTVQEYCADFEKQLRKLDQHGVTLPDKVVGWFFLRRAGLRQDQLQMIMSTLAAEKISLDTVRKAVNFVIGQDAIPQGSMTTSPMANKYGKAASSKESMFFEDEADEEIYALQEETWDEFEEAYAYHEEDEDAVYYEDPAEEVVGAEEAVTEFDEVYAAYTDARQRLNQMRVSRGFYPVVAMVPETKDSGGKKGYKGKKGKGKSSKGKSFQGGKQSPKPPSAVARGKAVLGSSEKCLRCGGYGHRAKACPHANKRKAESQETEAEILMVGEEDSPSTMEVCMHEDDGTESEPDDTAIWDSGAASVLVSRYHLRKYLKALMMKGFDIHTIKAWQCTKGFKFGNGNQDKTNLCVLAPRSSKEQGGTLWSMWLEARCSFSLADHFLKSLALWLITRTSRWCGQMRIGSQLPLARRESMSYTLRSTTTWWRRGTRRKRPWSQKTSAIMSSMTRRWSWSTLWTTGTLRRTTTSVKRSMNMFLTQQTFRSPPSTTWRQRRTQRRRWGTGGSWLLMGTRWFLMKVRRCLPFQRMERRAQQKIRRRMMDCGRG